MRKLTALIFVLTAALGMTAYGQSGYGGGSSGGSGYDGSGGGTGGSGSTSGIGGGSQYNTPGTGGATDTGGAGGGAYGPSDTSGMTGTGGATSTSGVGGGTGGSMGTDGMTGTSGSTSTSGIGGGTGGSTGTDGMTGTSGSTSTMGAGGATGGAAGDVATMKQDFQLRLDQVDTQISDMKKGMKNMSGAQKDTMNQQMKDIKAKRDSVKKMIGNMKTNADNARIENELSSLEQQVRSMSSGSQRSTPAGDMESSDPSMSQGGATGGASSSMGVEQSTGTHKTKKKSTKKSTGGATGTSGSTSTSMKSSGGATGGAAGTDGKTSTSGSTSTGMKSSGGTTGGATGTDVSQVKKTMKDRLNVVDKQITTAKDAAKKMPTQQKDAQMMQIDKVEGQRDGVKKMVDELSSSQNVSQVENALMQLEQSAKGLESKTQRSTPAGDSTTQSTTSSSTSSSSTGGTSGGGATMTGTATSTDTGMTSGGGMTGGAVMDFSYDQREEFARYEKTRLDGFTKRIDSLRTIAKNSPQNINSNLSPKVDELYGMKNTAEDKVTKIKNSDRKNWNTTKAEVEKSLSDLEQKLMEAEKNVK
jgi:hypothetical protein